MRHMTRCLLSILLFAAATCLAEQHALLIGVSEYPNLEKSAWLEGPPADCEMMKTVLTGPRFKVPTNNVQILSGWPKEKAKRPTLDNIRQAFEALSEKVEKGDQVMILMSGHGSQIPADPDPKDMEPDGLDEVFLPADTKKWDEKTKEIKGVIRDDDIKVWVDRIRAQGVFVWIIFDSCHSGTMTRGMTNRDRVARQIDPTWLTPPSALRAASKAAGTRGANNSNENEWNEEATDGTGGLVAMYAAQSLEPTFELPLPEPTSGKKGLFTFTILQILQNTEEPISYRDLADLVNVVYRGNGLFQPTPLVEGTGMDNLLLSSKQIPDPGMLHFTGAMNPFLGFQVQAGSLVGLRSGSILEIFPPAGSAESETSLGAVKVTKCEATSSYVVPAKWEQLAAADIEDIGLGCRAKVVFENYGTKKLKIGLAASEGEKAEPIDPASPPDEWKDAVKALTKGGTGTFTLTSSEEADWVVRRDKKGFSLQPAAGWSARNLAKGAPQTFYPGDDAGLRKAVEQISRTQNLMRLAGDASGRRSDVKMNVEIVRFEDGEEEVLDFGEEGRTLRPGDEVAFRIHNKGRTTIDVSLLFIDSGMGITALFPEPGTVDDNRIPPRKTITTPRIEVTADTSGPEQVVALGVRASRERVDFSCLEQPSLATTRGVAALDSPLGQLLKTTIYGEGETRGMKRSSASSYASQLLTWETRVD